MAMLKQGILEQVIGKTGQVASYLRFAHNGWCLHQANKLKCTIVYFKRKLLYLLLKPKLPSQTILLYQH